MGEARLKVPCTAVATSTGAITFRFEQPGSGRSWVGTVGIIGASGAQSLTATVDAAPWGSWTANTPSGTIQAIEFEVLEVIGTGFIPGQSYTAWWIGADQDLANAALLGPANPLTANISGALNFQHNDAPVANEAAVDFEDGLGTTWTITDDPAAKRVKVTAALSALLARSSYGPGTVTGYTIGSTGTLAALDTTNLTLAFTVPASGAVVVSAFGGAWIGTMHNVYLGLYAHGTGNLVGVVQGPFLPSGPSQLAFRQLLTGLAPGATQVDLAATCPVGQTGMNLDVQADASASLAGFSAGPILLEAWAA